MSCIRQYQRRALEGLRPSKDYSFRVSSCNMDEYYLDNQRIYLLGISKGIGTCSDLHGINIAVFSHNKPNGVQMPGCQEKEIFCSWGALLREPTEEEFQKELVGKKGVPHLVVELIEPILIIEKEEDKQRICYFVSTKKKEFYANII